MPTPGADRPIQRVPRGLPGPGGIGWSPLAQSDDGGRHHGFTCMSTIDHVPSGVGYCGWPVATPNDRTVDSPLKSVAELKGKKVAIGRGWNVQYLLVRALEENGLSFDDIQPAWVNNAADARSAFESGKVDAVGLWDPFLASAQVGSSPRVLRNGEGLSNNRTFHLGAPAFEKFRQLELVAKRCRVLIDGKARTVGGDLEQDAARLAEIDGPEVIAILLFRHAHAMIGFELRRHRGLRRIIARPESDVMHRARAQACR